MEDQPGRPAVPPRQKGLRTVTRFSAFLGRSWQKATNQGLITVTFTVPHEDKWQALLLDAAEGYRLHVEVSRADDPTDDELIALLGLEVSE